MSENNGVTVTTREIYDSVNKISTEVLGLGNRFDNLELMITNQNKETSEASERSHLAYNKAHELEKKLTHVENDTLYAIQKTRELETTRYEDKISETKKAKENRNQFYISILSAVTPWVLAILLGIIYIAKTNMF